jgi:hypothetical protein
MLQRSDQPHRYIVKPASADSPSQNRTVKIYIGKLAVCTWTQLYSSGLPAKHWSSTLLHSVYLHNHLVHTTMKKTPFETYFGICLDLARLKLFGSWVCAKVSGICHCKFDRHNFKGASS